jgi:hypothetical protein
MRPVAAANRRAAPANLLHRLHRRPQLGEPLVGVLTDQADRPDQRLRPGAGHPGVDERVENQALALAQAGHHRHRGVGEDLAVVAAGGTPGDRPAVPLLRGVRDGHPLLPGLLAEARDPPRAGGSRVALTRLGLGERADDGDLVAVDGEVHRAGEPAVGQPSGEPAGDLGALDRWSGVHAATATTTAGETRAEGGVGETMSVHGDLLASC